MMASGRPGDLRQDGVGVHADRLEPVHELLLVAQRPAVLVPVVEERTVDVEELLGHRVPHGHAHLQRHEPAVGVGVVPDVRLPSSTCTCPSENGRNVTSQSAPSASAPSTWALRAKGQR